jgi:hypothetical protein
MPRNEPSSRIPPVTTDHPAAGSELVPGDAPEQPAGGRTERTAPAARERVTEAGLESFPASDPPSWWAGA